MNRQMSRTGSRGWKRGLNTDRNFKTETWRRRWLREKMSEGRDRKVEKIKIGGDRERGGGGRRGGKYFDIFSERKMRRRKGRKNRNFR